MSAPELTVVVAGSRPEGVPSALFDVLSAELASGAVEVVVATARPAPEPSQPPGVTVVRRPAGTSIPVLRSAGMAASRAPLVTLTEDFCAPSPGWYAAIVDELRGGSAIAVGGPVTRRVGRLRDWATTFCEYGRFLCVGAALDVPDLPAVNVTYDRRRLESVLGELPEEFVETAIHARLRDAAETFRCVPDAVVIDENRLRFRDTISAQFHHGRLFGGRRVAHCGVGTRMLRAALSLLVPWVLLARIVRIAARAAHGARAAAAAPLMLVLLIAWAAGEALGSLFGEGDAAEHWT